MGMLTEHHRLARVRSMHKEIAIIVLGLWPLVLHAMQKKTSRASWNVIWVLNVFPMRIFESLGRATALHYAMEAAERW